MSRREGVEGGRVGCVGRGNWVVRWVAGWVAGYPFPLKFEIDEERVLP